MNKIVKQHYPIDKLPEELREGLPKHASARVTVEVEVENSPADHDMSLEDIFALVPAADRLSTTEIRLRIEGLRNEWER